MLDAHVLCSKSNFWNSRDYNPWLCPGFKEWNLQVRLYYRLGTGRLCSVCAGQMLRDHSLGSSTFLCEMPWLPYWKCDITLKIPLCQSMCIKLANVSGEFYADLISTRRTTTRGTRKEAIWDQFDMQCNNKRYLEGIRETAHLCQINFYETVI